MKSKHKKEKVTHLTAITLDRQSHTIHTNLYKITHTENWF